MPYSCKSYVHGTIGESAVCHRGSRRHQSGSRLLPSDAEVFLASLKTHPRTGTANRVSPEYGGEKNPCYYTPPPGGAACWGWLPPNACCRRLFAAPLPPSSVPPTCTPPSP